MARNQLEIWRRRQDGEWYCAEERPSPRSAIRNLRGFLASIPGSAAAIYWDGNGVALNATDAVVAGADTNAKILDGARADAGRLGPPDFIKSAPLPAAAPKKYRY